jgi:hypothetical protein
LERYNPEIPRIHFSKKCGNFGGEGEIRTREELSFLDVFKTSRDNRSLPLHQGIFYQNCRNYAMINVWWFSMILGKCLFCHKEFIKKRRKRKFCSLLCSNNFNRNGLINIKLPNYSKHLAEFVGIMLGDGHVSKYQIGITLNSIADKEYVTHVLNLIKLLFPKLNASFNVEKPDNAARIRVNSRLLANFFYDMGIIPKNKRVPKWILSSPLYRYSCVRGLFDTEGSISFKTYKTKNGFSVYKQLNFRNTNKRLMRFVRNTLKNVGLKPTMTLKKSLYLSTHESIEYFSERIGFSNPKLIERSNICTTEEYFAWKNNRG